MSDNTGNISIYTAALVDKLLAELERQVKMAQKGSLAEVELSINNTQKLVEQVAQAGVLQKPEYENKRNKIRNLYERLLMILSAEKDKAGSEIKTVRNYKKVFNTYMKSLKTGNIK
jgi:hypothetical protein